MDDGPPSARRQRWVPKRPLPAPEPGEVRLLAGGNPQVPKGDGSGPVAAYIAAMPGWKRSVGERIDALVAEAVPQATRAVRWNVPFWGVAGRGWFLSLSCTAGQVKIAWLTGAALVPPPPVALKHPMVRYLHVTEGEAPDAAQLRAWLAQAAVMEGERLF